MGLPASLFRHLLQALQTNDSLEVAHHHRIRVRSGHRPDNVEGVVDVGHPVAHGFIERVFQGFGAGLNRHHRRAEQLHALHVLLLAHDIGRTHIDHAFHAVARRHRRTGHAVLAGTGFGDDARLAHAPGQQGLTDGVVDLVRAGVVEIFALEIDLRAAELLGPAPGVIDRRRTADEVRQLVMKLRHKIGIFAKPLVGIAQFGQRVHQGFSDESSAVRTKMARGIGEIVGFQAFLFKTCASAATTAATKASMRFRSFLRGSD